MKTLYPFLLLILLACSSKPAEQSGSRADSVTSESPSEEMGTDKGADLSGDFIPHMTIEDHTVTVMLKGVDTKFTFPAGGEAMEKREDGFGFTYPGQPGTNLNKRTYRFKAHSLPCDIEGFDDEGAGEIEIETKTIRENLYTIKNKSEGAAGSMYSTFLYYFDRGDICFQFYLDLKTTSSGIVEGTTDYDLAKELAEFEAMLARLEIMEGIDGR